jgi:ketosteroid isomerase-like protein
MKSSDIKNVIQKFFETVNKRQYDRLRAFFSPDIVFFFPGTKPLHGPHKVLQLLKIIAHRYPDLMFEVIDIIIQDDQAAVVWKNRGKDLHGSPYQNEGVTIFRLENGRIGFMSDYFKDTSFVT